MSFSAPASAHQRIARLATLTAVHRAFHWLHLHQPQLRLWQLEMLSIPAPPFGEAARADWFLERFAALCLSNVHLDGVGNVLAELGPASSPASPCILLSAHLDTVFPAALFSDANPCRPTEDGARILCPGACDNAAGLTALLAIAAALRFAEIAPPTPILFAANVGEEGEGDLRGMKQIFLHGAYRDRIAAAIALEGSGASAIVTKALASRRFRITVTGPGGHSWTDSDRPNPVLVLSRMIARIGDIGLPTHPRTTVSVGQVAGGTSVNSIPESAIALIDLRSTETAQLHETEAAVRSILAESAAEHAARREVQVTIETIGDRPGGHLPDDAPLFHTVLAVDRHLTLSTEQRLGSTDANLPISLGVPAIALGAGGTGGGIHTLQEWYDPTGRETALRRVLLVLLDSLYQVSGSETSSAATLDTLHP